MLEKAFYYNEFRKGETYTCIEDCLFLNIFAPTLPNRAAVCPSLQRRPDTPATTACLIRWRPAVGKGQYRFLWRRSRPHHHYGTERRRHDDKQSRRRIKRPGRVSLRVPGLLYPVFGDFAQKSLSLFVNYIYIIK